jgi:hypothetical protein
VSARPTYSLTLVDMPGYSAPAPVRLRRLLKLAGRVFGLRCIAAREVTVAADDAGAAAAPPNAPANAPTPGDGHS